MKKKSLKSGGPSCKRTHVGECDWGKWVSIRESKFLLKRERNHSLLRSIGHNK